MADITLFVNGLKWQGWIEATVTRSIESVFGQFTLKMTRGWPGPNGQDVPPIRKGDECRLALAGETVITGYINNIDLGATAKGFDLRVSGRDKTGLLFKGDVLNDPAEWHGVDALKIATDVCAPFGITVTAAVSVGAAFKKFTCQPGETANEAIKRLCRHRGLYHYADVNGNLVLANASAATTASQDLAFGKDGNALSSNFQDGLENQHSEYIVRNQKAGEAWGSNDHNKITASAKDSTVKQYCPKIIIPDEPGDTEAALKLATQTAALAAGQARQASYGLAGWRQTAGAPLWDINQNTKVRDAISGLDAVMMIKQAVFSVKPDQAPMVDLTVVDPAAYSLVAVPEDAKGGWS